ncbi:tetratricopeptide repeat protein [Dongia sp.]|uniref:tetratricopeptide repeat protein n=1 Tax=Dongia sp. TaxID=1977262 RepID=UPI0035AEF8CF
MNWLRLGIGGVFLLAVAAGGVAGYLSVDPLPPTPVAATTAPTEPDMGEAAQASYGPEWPVCRDMDNNPRLRLRACTTLLERKVLTPQHQSWALNYRGTAYRQLGRYREAIHDFTGSIEIDGKNHAPYVNLASMAQSHGRLTEALELADKAIALKPEDQSPYCIRAKALLKLGRNKDGLATLENAEKFGPLGDCSLLVRADLLVAEGEREKARAVLAGVGKTAKMASHAMCKQARLLSEEGKTKEAFNLYRQAMERDQDNICAALHVASLAPYVLDFENAMAIVDQVIATHPQAPELLCYRGTILSMQSRESDALAAFNEAIELAPAHACAYVYRSELLATQGDLRAALADIEAAITLDPEWLDMLRRRGDILVRLKRWDDALKSYGGEIERDPKNIDAFQARGETELILQFYPQAAADFAAAIKLRPEDGMLHYRSAVANVAAQTPAAAISTCSQINTEDRNWSLCRMVSAQARVVSGDLPGAIQELAQIPKDAPIRRSSELLLAGAYLMNGDMREARNVVERHRAAYSDQPYGAIWSALLARASHQRPADDIRRLAKANDIWPTPILKWLVEGGDAQTLFDAADTPDLNLSKQRRADAEFYLGLAAKIDGSKNEALRHFVAAKDLGYLEHSPFEYPATYGNANGNEFALAAWAVRKAQ